MSIAATIVTPALAQAVPIPEPQTRGYFLPLFAALTHEALENEVERAVRAGFNLLVYPIFTNGWTLFPSVSQRLNSVPAISPIFKGWNPLARVVELARAGNVSVWGLARGYNFHPRHAVTPHKLLQKNPGWRMLRHPSLADEMPRGREFWHPCPLQHGELGRRTYRHALAEILIEAIEGYPLSGVLIDCTGFGLCGGTLSQAPFCFCKNCCSRYEERFGASMIEDADGTNLLRVRAWQQEQAQEHLNYLRHRLLRTRRTLRIVCEATPYWRENPDYIPARDGGALIDWPELLNEGEIEELLVHHEYESPGPDFGSRIAADLAFLGDQVLFMPSLSVRHPGELRGPLTVLSRYTIPGFIAEFAEPLSEAAMIELSSTIFAESAPLPESEPVRAAMFLLERVRQAHENQPKIHDLMSDLLRLLARQNPIPRDFNSLLVLEENIQGLEQFIRRGKVPGNIPAGSLRNLGLARRFVRMALMDVRS